MLFRLIRLPNLIIVAVTQGLIYYQLLNKTFRKYSLSGTFNSFEFALFAVATILVTASGYIINDIYDIETDRVNKPDKSISQVQLSKSNAWKIYFSMILTGGLISLYLALQRNDLFHWFIYPVAVFLLYGYSRWFKGVPYMGNILVSLFCAAVPGIFFLSEASILKELKIKDLSSFLSLHGLLLSYVIFAFLTNLYREIVKDLQDEAGDKLANINTAAVYFGKKTTKFVALFIALVISMVITFTFSQTIFSNIPYLFTIQCLLIQLPLSVSIIKLIQAKDDKAFRNVGLWIKLIMINGLILITYLTINPYG
ncbi:MAG: geranylgeranylglycerol-phosphate geranylgeranyltransferase [Bacteroidota bacterium]